MVRARSLLAVALISSAFAARSHAAVIGFTGGTVVRLDASVETTNNVVDWDNVDYYEESGYRLDFLPNGGSGGFATHVGNYYGVGNDVIHSHWATGSFGGVMTVEITKIGGGTFDLNGFILTSNTDTGGSFASGNEQSYIEGFNSNASTGSALLLPPEDWGFPGTNIPLGSQFDVVDRVVFSALNQVDCFGMDEFYIDEAFIPEPGTFGLTSLGLVGLAIYRRRKSA